MLGYFRYGLKDMGLNWSFLILEEDLFEYYYVIDFVRILLYVYVIVVLKLDVLMVGYRIMFIGIIC